MSKSFKSTIFFLLLTYSTLGVGQNYWDLRSAFNTGKPTVALRASGSTYAVLNNTDVGTIVTTVDKFSLLSGIYPKILIKESNELNAFAGVKDGAPFIIINKPMYDILIKDKDVAASVIGHEMAHLYLNHGLERASTADALNAIGFIAGIALEILFRQRIGVADVGFYSGAAIATVATNSYTRNQEREADKLGIEWMHKAGYDTNGAIRLFEMFEGKFGNSFLTFLKTHPNPSERIENAKQQIALHRKLPDADPNPLGLSPKLFALNQKIDAQNIQLIPKSELGKLGLSAYAKKDFETSFKNLNACANNGEATCQIYLGYQYQFGLGITKDVDKALSLFTQAKENGLAYANYAIYTTMGLRNKDLTSQQSELDPKKAVGMLIDAAKDGSAEAMGMVTFVYVSMLEQLGEEKIKNDFPDKEILADYAKLASMRGIPSGYLALGVSYLFGIGMPKDIDKAEEYLLRVRSNFRGTDSFLLLVAEEKNDKTKIDFYTKALASKKTPLLTVRLRKRYCSLTDSIKSREKCAYWAKEGALLGDISSANLYGILLHAGLGITKDEIEGAAWLYYAQQNGVNLTERSDQIIKTARTKSSDLFEAKFSEIKQTINK